MKRLFLLVLLVAILLLGSVMVAGAEQENSAIVYGENDGICDGEYWAEDLTSPYRWVKNPAWKEPTCDYERVQEALDNNPGGKILLSGIFDFNDRNVAIMHDNTEIYGDGSAVIKNGANTFTVGHIRHDIQYHFADFNQFDHFKMVRNFVIDNIRFEESLQTAISVIGHDGESYITNNEFVGGRFTEEDVGYDNHSVNGFVLVWNLLYMESAVQGIINVDHNYMDGQLRIDPNGYKFWYYDRPDLTYNGMVWGIGNFITAAIINANYNTMVDLSNPYLSWVFPFSDSGELSVTNNDISISNGPYSHNVGIQFVGWEFAEWDYLIAENDITLDYSPELDFATYPEWGSDPTAEYLHAYQYSGISLDFWASVDVFVDKNTIRFTENFPDDFSDYDYTGVSCIELWHYTSDTVIARNKFIGSGLFGIDLLGGNTGNIMEANNFEHFTPFSEGFFHLFGYYLQPADIAIGSRFPSDYNVVIAGGSSSGKLDIIDNGVGNIVGNNNVAHTDPHLLKDYHDAIRELRNLDW